MVGKTAHNVRHAAERRRDMRIMREGRGTCSSSFSFSFCFSAAPSADAVWIKRKIKRTRKMRRWGGQIPWEMQIRRSRRWSQGCRYSPIRADRPAARARYAG
jgi:hypothetical protein